MRIVPIVTIQRPPVGFEDPAVRPIVPRPLARAKTPPTHFARVAFQCLTGESANDHGKLLSIRRCAVQHAGSFGIGREPAVSSSFFLG